jgi:hypothetical protein
MQFKRQLLKAEAGLRLFAKATDGAATYLQRAYT